jgi:hypothetical protein
MSETDVAGNIFRLLHPYIRILIVGILFIMPIWFADIFLFNRKFFEMYPPYISIVLSYCLTLGSLIPSFYLSYYAKIGRELYDTSNEVQIILNSGILIAVILLLLGSGVFFVYRLYNPQISFLSFVGNAVLLVGSAAFKTFVDIRREKQDRK